MNTCMDALIPVDRMGKSDQESKVERRDSQGVEARKRARSPSTDDSKRSKRKSDRTSHNSSSEDDDIHHKKHKKKSKKRKDKKKDKKKKKSYSSSSSSSSSSSDTDEQVARSAITGKKLKLKVSKSSDDKVREKNRRDLLHHLNQMYD